MGKGKRVKKQRAGKPLTPVRAVPEMLPNTADSMNDMPKPGYRSEHLRDRLEPDVQAWNLLNIYIGLLMSIEDARDGGSAVSAEPGEDPEQEAQRLLDKLRPLGMVADRENAAVFISMMKPRWRGTVMRKILREALNWMTESGFQPDHATWFEGARLYGQFMAPDAQQDEVVNLLDYMTLIAERRELDLPDDELPVAFDIDKPEESFWFARAMRAHPVAAIHAAAALAIWVHAQPGAVLDVGEKRLELAQRSRKFHEIVGQAPGRDPNAPEEPEYPPFVPAWEQRRADSSPASVPLNEEISYDGPAITPWRAAYMWASMLSTLCEFPVRDTRTFADAVDPGDSMERAIMARAISIVARKKQLTPDKGMVRSPAVIRAVSMPEVSLSHLNPVLASMRFPDHRLGHMPTPGEPGYQSFLDVGELLGSLNVTADQLQNDPQLDELVKTNNDRLIKLVNKANSMIIKAVQYGVPDDPALPTPDDISLATLGWYLNTYLANTDQPDEDAEFQTLMEQYVGWPSGNPPAGIYTDEGPWLRVGYTPRKESRGPGAERARAWCRWLLKRGWAEPFEADMGGVWLAVPKKWADPLWMIGMEMGGFASTGMSPWNHQDENDGPGEEWLRAHYGHQED
jgi:hypothetical protein